MDLILILFYFKLNNIIYNYEKEKRQIKIKNGATK